MAGYETDIHALIDDINGNYGNYGGTQYEQPALPYSRPLSNSYQSRNGPLVDPRQTPTSSYNQQPLYAAQASNPYDAHSHGLYEDAGLGTYGKRMQIQPGNDIADYWLDQALLAESQHQGSKQIGSGMNAPSTRRLSLPGHTAPFSPTGTFVQRDSQPKHRGQCLGFYERLSAETR